MPRSKSSLTSLSYVNNISQSNSNVNSDTSSTTKYSIPINKNNTQELENSSFILKKYEGSNIDITNLKENDSMLRLHYKRKYNKDKWEDAYYRNRSNLNKSMYHLSENALSEVNDALNNPNTDQEFRLLKNMTT